MAPISTVLAVALLAFGSVDAKRKDKVSYSRYYGTDCNGHPISGDISDLKLEDDRKSHCQQISGSGIRFHKQKKDKHSKWINDVNSGKDTCVATLYSGYGCKPENFAVELSLPADFQKCTSLDSSGISSVQFRCNMNESYASYDVRQELNLPVTSYSIAADGKAHPSVYTTTFNATRHVYPPDTFPVDSPALNARAEPTRKASLEPRRKKYHNAKGVWMKHPWTGSDLCYKCYTKHENDFRKFDCRSGHGDKYNIDCGLKPAPVPPTSTHRVTHTTTIEFYRTVADQFYHLPTPVEPLEKRSRHTPVVLKHPYLPDEEVCADAEFENEGDSYAEIRIQKVKKLEKCSGKNSININIGVPDKVLYSTVTETKTTIHATRPAWVFRPTPATFRVIDTDVVTVTPTTTTYVPVTYTETVHTTVTYTLSPGLSVDY